MKMYTLETNKYGDQAWVERLDDQAAGRTRVGTKWLSTSTSVHYAGTLVRVRLLTDYQAWQPSATDTEADVVAFLDEDPDATGEAEGWVAT